MTGTKTCPKPTFPVPGACGPNLRQINSEHGQWLGQGSLLSVSSEIRLQSSQNILRF